MRIILIVLSFLILAGCATSGLGTKHKMTPAEQDKWLSGKEQKGKR